MNTIPKTQKYRIRRDTSVTTGAQAAQPRDPVSPQAPAPTGPAGGQDADAGLFENHEDGFGNMRFADAARSDDSAQATGERITDAEIEAVRAEALTGRQLRLARRMAQRHGIEASSDFEAVVLLRRQGIDPFDRSNIIAMVKPEEAASAQGLSLVKVDGGGTNLAPQRSPGPSPRTLPSTEVLTEDARAREIIRIQRDITKRRRRKLALLGSRLAFFVFLPTLIAGWYYYNIATPLYATHTEFVIQKADGMTQSGLGGLFSGTQLATNQDSITVQSSLQSGDAMQRLERDQQFKATFQAPEIDPIQRLPDPSTDEEAYKLYKRMVKIGYDPTEGVVKMEVKAPDPQVSRRFSEALISYAEDQVDKLTARLRDDQMEGALESYRDAEEKVFAAQAKVLELQQKVGVLDPITENNLVMSQISGLETEMQKKRLELGQLLDNPRPNQARVSGVQGDMNRLQTEIAMLRAQLTNTKDSGDSLAAITGRLRIAEGELQTRQMLLSAAAQQMETARIEANKQVRYLEMGVRPVAPDEPSYPRAFENTLLAFLIFSGIYLMLSLTASILREQVSS